jgi:hypothetical protein
MKQKIAWDKLNVISQILIAAVACIGIYLTLRQERLAQRQMQLDEAAQMRLDSATITSFQSGKPEIALFFKNTGRTPALDGKITAMSGFIGTSGRAKDEVTAVEKNFKLLATDAGSLPLTTLYASDSRKVPITFPEQPLSPDQVQQIDKGDFRYMVFGTFEYKDIFGTSYKKRFCLNFHPSIEDGQDFIKSFIDNYMKKLPADEDDAAAMRNALTDAAVKLPQPPQPMDFCIAGND